MVGKWHVTVQAHGFQVQVKVQAGVAILYHDA